MPELPPSQFQCLTRGSPTAAAVQADIVAADLVNQGLCLEIWPLLNEQITTIRMQVQDRGSGINLRVEGHLPPYYALKLFRVEVSLLLQLRD